MTGFMGGSMWSRSDIEDMIKAEVDRQLANHLKVEHHAHSTVDLIEENEKLTAEVSHLKCVLNYRDSDIDELRKRQAAAREALDG